MKKRPRTADGFTLMEMMVVLAIVGILTAITAPSLVSVLRGSALTQGAFNVSGLLSFGRQAAITQNQAMEVRIYQYADPTFPGESAGFAATGKYRAFQIFEMTDAGTAVPWGKMVRLPTGIIVDSGSTLSSLLGPTLAKTWSTTDPQVPLPGVGTSYNCEAFRLRPDGSTNLSATPPTPPGSWCLTLHSIVLGDRLTTPPANFATIQVDPVAGKITTFHP